MKMVLVKWVDSTSIQGWEEGDNMELCRCESVGFLIKKTKDKVILAQSLNDHTYYNKFAIPRGCITSITVLSQSFPRTPPT